MDCRLRCTNFTNGEVRVAFAFIGFACIFSIAVFPEISTAAAPVVDAAAQGPALKDLETRLKRVENRLDNQGMVDLMSRFDQMQIEMQKIIGNLEVQNHQLQTLKKQQKDLYEDIDRRLRKLEQASSSNVPVSPAPLSGSGGIPGTPVPVQPAGNLGLATPDTSPQTSANIAGSPNQISSQTPSSQSESTMSEVERNVARSAYERAFNLLKAKRYDLAITSFKAFLDTYPYASYADNAQYWLGEANYANRQYKVALEEFQKVITNYPNSPKRADAMLKIGYTYVELDNKKMAMQTLNTIVSTYPGSTAAKLAEKRIQSMSANR